MSLKKPLSKNIRCLKDFMKDPNREEPLIGLEYVVEVRFKGRREPSYECQLCMFNTEMVPMIEHLTGQRHRKAYLIKHYPDKTKRTANDYNEDKAAFLRKVAREVEKTEGLNMYKREDFERPCISSTTAKKKALRFGGGYKPENDPVRREKVLEYMENFEITSDKEATRVINIAQSLSEDLKAFCENQATLNYIRSLPPLMSPGTRNAKQHKPNQSFESYKDDQGRDVFSETMMTKTAQGDNNWKHGCLTNGLAQLQSLLQHGPRTSHTPTDSYIYQMRENASSNAISSKEFAAVSALQNSFGQIHQPGFGCGINEWMKQFNQSASVYFQSTPAAEKSPYFTSPQSSYTVPQVLDNRMTNNEARKWDSMRNSSDSRTYQATSISYPPPITYQPNYPSQKFPSWDCDKSGHGILMPVPSFPSESGGPGWPHHSGYQQSNREGDLRSYLSFCGGSSHSNYQLQNTQMNSIMGECSSGPTADIMSQLRGKDAATLTNMLQQLVPHYPDLQKINIHALAQALSEMN
ncbi:uncharacterized protein LOC133366676 isoform X2 [Rhineura floridana]|nr:uncharacterized protein LOC133366676 isoform X2 [Rhineura floridana]